MILVIVCLLKKPALCSAAVLFVALLCVLKIDTILDYEVYSRLTIVLSTISCARNRIGFYLANTFSGHFILAQRAQKPTQLKYLTGFGPTTWAFFVIKHQGGKGVRRKGSSRLVATCGWSCPKQHGDGASAGVFCVMVIDPILVQRGQIASASLPRTVLLAWLVLCIRMSVEAWGCETKAAGLQTPPRKT